MSVSMLSRVWQHSESTHSERLVMLAIADFADDNGEAFPSVPTLAKKAKITDRAVQNALTTLQDELKELVVMPNAGPGGRNLYRILIAADGAKIAPPKNIHPRKKCTGEDSSPPKTLHPTPEKISPGGRKDFTPTPEDSSPLYKESTVSEPSGEPSDQPSAVEEREPQPVRGSGRSVKTAKPAVFDPNNPSHVLLAACRSVLMPNEPPVTNTDLRCYKTDLLDAAGDGVTPEQVCLATRTALVKFRERGMVNPGSVLKHLPRLLLQAAEMESTPPGPASQSSGYTPRPNNPSAGKPGSYGDAVARQAARRAAANPQGATQ